MEFDNMKRKEVLNFRNWRKWGSRNEPVESPMPKSWRMTQPLLVPNKMTSLPAAMQVITPRPFAAYLSRRSTVNTCLPAGSIFQFNSLNSRFQFSPVLLQSKGTQVDYPRKVYSNFDLPEINYHQSPLKERKRQREKAIKNKNKKNVVVSFCEIIQQYWPGTAS